MITKEEYIELVRKFLTQSTDKHLESVADRAMELLQGMSLEEYMKDPLVCYNGRHRGNLRHTDMCVERFSALLPWGRESYNKIRNLIDGFKEQKPNTKEEEKALNKELYDIKLVNLLKYHLLPFSDGHYYHWNIDIDKVYGRGDIQLIPNISDDILRKDPCVLYAERSATFGLFALVAADPNKMDIDNHIFPIPTCCLEITKDSAQDDITQLRYLCGRDEQWQPHPVTYCVNYIKSKVKENKKKQGAQANTHTVTQPPKTKGGLNTDILSGTVCDLLNMGANVTDGIYEFSKSKGLFNHLERYNYTRNDLELVPRKYGSGWDNVDFKEESPKPRLKSRKEITCRYLNEAIEKGEITLVRGKIYIIPTGCGKSYALGRIKNPRTVFLTTRIGLVDEFAENNDGQWERLYPSTKVEDGKQYYGTAQGISDRQIELLKEYDYTFHIDEIHSWFEFTDQTDKLNYILSPEPNIIGYTASATEHLRVWAAINNYEMTDYIFSRKKQKLSLQLVGYHYINKTILAAVATVIEKAIDDNKKIVVYLNDKDKIEQIAKSIPTEKIYTYYTTEQKEREARDEWEIENKMNLKNYKKSKSGACLLCTSKLGLGANFHNVVDLFVVFSNDPDSIQQIIAREREKDVTLLLFSKTFSSSYLEHKVGWQNVLDDYYRGNNTTKVNPSKQKVYTEKISTAITDWIREVYEKYSEVFYNNLFYILKKNWRVENRQKPNSRIFPIPTIKKEAVEKDKVIGKVDVIYKELMVYISSEKDKRTKKSASATIDFAALLSEDFNVMNQSEKIRYIRLFIEKYNELQKELHLPDLLTLQDMEKKEVYEIIKSVKKRCKQKNPNLWTTIKAVLEEKGFTEKFTKADIPSIEQEVKKRYPSFTTTLKSVLKDHYRFDWDTMCYVRRSKKSNATIKRENTDKKLLEHLTDNKMEITSKSVKEAMEVLQIEGNPDSIVRRLKRKTKKVC